MDLTISIRGARTHNLAGISLDLPRQKLSVVTGVSGSGKSSLVFDTLYAEGQRRYVQSLSTYARLFLEQMERPDVESISDIPPALALRQKNSIRNARSTVGSVTEISDYLRLLFATVGRTFCRRCGTEVRRDSVETATARIAAAPGRYLFLAPFETRTRSPEDSAAFLMRGGYHRLYAAGKIVETAESALPLAARRRPLMVVIDRTRISGDEDSQRLREALEHSFRLGAGRARVLRVEHGNGRLRTADVMELDRRFNCPRCDVEYPEPTPGLFSANSPIGACPQCDGFGRVAELDLDKVVPDPGLSLRQGAVAPWRTPAYRDFNEWMLKLAQARRIRTTIPLRQMNDRERSWLIEGDPGREERWRRDRWPGVRGFFKWLEGRRYKTHVRILQARYRRFMRCPGCEGTRLRPEALNVRVGGKSIAEVGRIAIRDFIGWIEEVEALPEAAGRAAVLLNELRNRIGYLSEVGLGYLNLERQARTLSGGEAQRIHLARALGNLLTGTLYALDEPTVGLHAADARRLLGVLRHLRDLGNTVVVVEHDPVIIQGADLVVELGPGGGSEGGRLLRAGAPRSAAPHSSRRRPGRVLLMRAIARERRLSRRDPAISIIGASEHNLRNINVTIPLGRMVCVTGVSGSGKSTLVEEVLYKNYLRERGDAVEAGECTAIRGLDQAGEMIHLSQELPARSARSNPATYLKVYDEIRRRFAEVEEASRLGIRPRDFSFNVAGGRCERCKGVGSVTVEMHFMPDLEARCEVCDGGRFKSHILAIRYRGLNIKQVLDLTVDQARSFYADCPAIIRRLDPLAAVGLGYLRLGQTTSTLSGGEAQRLRLARFLLADLEPVPVADDGRRLPRMFLLDEPTTGLSSTDIRRLLNALWRLVSEGNTLVVIEHNLEFIANANYLIDLGPGGGDAGGRVVATGGPARVARCRRSVTGRELSRLFGIRAPVRRRVLGSAIARAAHS